MTSSAAATDVKECACVGRRFCKICAPERFESAGAVSSETHSTAQLDLLWCPQCARLLHPAAAAAAAAAASTKSASVLLSCKDHSTLATFDEAQLVESSSYFPFVGLRVLPNFLSPPEEAELIQSLDSGGWSASQSGRKKVDFFAGKLNFKEKKSKLKEFCGAPREVVRVMEKVSLAVSPMPSGACKLSSKYSNCSAGILIPSQDEAAKHVLRSKTCSCLHEDESADGERPFQCLGVAGLEYGPDMGAHLAPHLDDGHFYGPRIAGVSLASDSVMTFSQQCSSSVAGGSNSDKSEQLAVNVRVPLIQRALFVMFSSVRYHWLHGIQSEDLAKNRRVSLTFREPSANFIQSHPEIVAALLARVKQIQIAVAAADDAAEKNDDDDGT